MPLSDIECPCGLRCPGTVVSIFMGRWHRSPRWTVPAAHWASWVDAFKMIKDRHWRISFDASRRPEESMTIRTVVECSAVLKRDPSQPRVGWQPQVATSIERHCHNTVWPGLREHEKAPRKTADWHQFQRKRTRETRRHPTSTRARSPTQSCGNQAPGEVHQHESAEVFRDCDS